MVTYIIINNFHIFKTLIIALHVKSDNKTSKINVIQKKRINKRTIQPIKEY